MRDRERIDLFIIEPILGTMKYKIRRLRRVSPTFNRHAGRIVGASGYEIDSRHIVGGVHKRCATACNGISNADVTPHDWMGLDDVRDATRTTVARQVRQQAVAVA